MKWGILTDGRYWRLYERSTSKDNTFYAVDLESLLRYGEVEDFYYFYLFFRREAFAPAGWLERILSGSVDYAESLSDQLEDEVYNALELIAQGFLSLKYLDAHSVDTDVWEMATHAELGNVTEFERLDFDLSLDVKDSARFLEALNLKKVGTGPLKISMSSQGKTENFTSTLSLAAGQSQIDTKLETTTAGERPKTTGKISSKTVAVKDVKYAIAVGSQLGKLGQKQRSEKAKSAKPKANATQLLEPEDLLLDQDVAISIDIEKIVGTKAVTSLSSQLTATDGLAKLGPVEIAYDGAHFAGSAEMDMIHSPKLLSVNGTGKGWDLNDALKAIGLGYAAKGQLHGKFSFTVFCAPA